MQLLLDTHIMLGLAEPENFPLPLALYERLISGPENLFVSTASLWEIAIKSRLGKLPIDCPLSEWPSLLFVTGIHLVDIHVAHILADLDPVPDTKDPFDRLILATAAIDRTPLVTIDSALRDHPLAWRA